jgi:site-specific recombinase XerC
MGHCAAVHVSGASRWYRGNDLRGMVLGPPWATAIASWWTSIPTSSVRDCVMADLSRKGGNRPISRCQALRVLHKTYTTNGLTGKVAPHSMRKTFTNNAYRYLSQRRAAGEAIDPSGSPAKS